MSAVLFFTISHLHVQYLETEAGKEKVTLYKLKYLTNHSESLLGTTLKVSLGLKTPESEDL